MDEFNDEGYVEPRPYTIRDISMIVIGGAATVALMALHGGAYG